jgi:hypothetical protein
MSHIFYFAHGKELELPWTHETHVHHGIFGSVLVSLWWPVASTRWQNNFSQPFSGCPCIMPILASGWLTFLIAWFEFWHLWHLCWQWTLDGGSQRQAWCLEPTGAFGRFASILLIHREQNNIVVKALRYKPEGHGFKTMRQIIFIVLPNPSIHARAWSLLIPPNRNEYWK